MAERYAPSPNLPGRAQVAKSLEIENAVNDMLGIMVAYDFAPQVAAITESEIIKVKAGRAPRARARRPGGHSLRRSLA